MRTRQANGVRTSAVGIARPFKPIGRPFECERCLPLVRCGRETAKVVHEKLERLAVCQEEENEEEIDSIRAELKEMDISVDSRLCTWRKGARERRGRGRGRGRGGGRGGGGRGW